MSLFFTNQILHSVKENSLKLETPLGDIVFEVKINEFSLNIDSLSNIKSTDFNGFLSSWKKDNYIIDCLRVKFDPILPSDMKVDKCFAFIWRIKALEKLDISLNCLLKTSLIGSPETGEYLIAQSFENKSTELFIGTEDEEKLEFRAKNNDWVPSRFESKINADNIRYLDQGIEVNFSLLKEEKIQIQFIVAWSLKKDRELSTWYAVEQPTIEILKQVGFC